MRIDKGIMRVRCRKKKAVEYVSAEVKESNYAATIYAVVTVLSPVKRTKKEQ